MAGAVVVDILRAVSFQGKNMQCAYELFSSELRIERVSMLGRCVATWMRRRCPGELMEKRTELCYWHRQKHSTAPEEERLFTPEVHLHVCMYAQFSIIASEIAIYTLPT
jgi:hypothetical protein